MDDKISPLVTSTEAKSVGEEGDGETDESRKGGTCVMIHAHVN